MSPEFLAFLTWVVLTAVISAVAIRRDRRKRARRGTA